MKKNSGFIATSLLYSFFLLFCAILLGLIGTFLHNRTLHNNTIDNIKESLSNVGNITLAEAEVGSYVKIPIFTSGITISIENINWIVASNNSDTTTLVSSDIIMMTNIKDISLLQDNIDRFFNMYTTGSTSQNYMTYFTKELIDDFELLGDVILKKSLLSNDDEYFYYDEISEEFYLYQYTCNINNECEAEEPVKIEPDGMNQYGLRLVMNVSSTTPVAAGIGVLNNPYEVLYYTQDSFLVLHYDNLNNSRNKGIISDDNYVRDLTGINPDGILDSGTYRNDQTGGITIRLSRTINTNLNIYDIINSPNGYTIEFRAKNYLRLGSSPDYLTQFIRLNNNTNLSIYTTYNPTGLTTGSFNTISLIKRIDSNKLDIYINGVFLNDNNNLVSSPNNILYIGGSNNNEIFKSIRVYNTALTEEEIIHNYNVDMRWNA